MRLTRPLATLLACALLATVAACGGGGRDTTASKVTIGFTAEPPTLDLTSTPAAAVPQVLLYNVYEGLVRLDDKTGQIRPLLAQRWDLSADRRTYTFHLQPKATFSDGRPLTADDVVFSIERVLNQVPRHPFRSQMEVVEKASKLGAHTVQVRLRRPSNNWLFYMTSTVGIVFDRNRMGQLATRPAGSGPYTLGNWLRGSSITLVRNERYWGPRAKVGSAVFRYFKDPNAMSNSMLAGDLDIMSSLQVPELIPLYSSDTERFFTHDGISNAEVVLSMNNSRGPLRDRRVRQAVTHAIDRFQLINSAWSGHGTVIGTMSTPADPWFSDRSRDYPYDPAKARELLAEAGYEKGLTLDLKLPTLPYTIRAGQFIESQLREVGITARISQLEFPARWLSEVFTQADYDMSIIAHVEPRDIEKYGDPDYYWRYDNPKVRELLAEADRTTPDRQIQLMRDVGQLLSEDAVCDWLYMMPTILVATRQVRGFPENQRFLSFDVTTVERTG